jgi:two-component system, NarL family, nitrate/nitrite response regulator NarL
MADDRRLVREAIREVLQHDAGFDVVAEASTGLQAISEAGRVLPDVALVAATLPGFDGLQATMLIRTRVPSCRVILLSDHEDLGLLSEALEAGAGGYLTGLTPVRELTAAIRAVHRGETLVPQAMVGQLLSRMFLGQKIAEGSRLALARLTRHEQHILALLGEGADNAGIARALGLVEESVPRHIQRLMRKLGVNTRVEAATFVMQAGVVEELARAQRGESIPERHAPPGPPSPDDGATEAV